MDSKTEKRVTRPRVSLKEKWEAVKRMEKGENSLSIAKELGVSQRVIYQWISVKDKIKKWYETSPEHAVGVNRKNLSQVYNQQLDEVVYLWYVDCVKQGIAPTGSMIRLKAMELNEQLGAGWPFQASDGWLSKWKKRRGIIINPEQRFGDEEPFRVFVDKFKAYVEQENINSDQVFICSEAFLCYKLLPSKNFGLMESGPKSEFPNKGERLSIVTCTNATGTLKLPLMVIGKTEEHFDQKTLDVKMQHISYKSQKFAWLDNDIFRDWFLDEFVPSIGSFFEERSLPQKAVLILDDHTVLLDENIFQAGDIKTMYLPPKVTRLLCMEEGVLENIKKRYRYKFLTNIYYAVEDGATVAEHVVNITMNEILHWLAICWNDITPFTISNLWKNIWPEMKDSSNSVMSYSEAEPPPNSEFLAILQRFQEFANINIDDLQDWFNSDRIMPSIPDEEIIMEVQKMFSDARNERRKAADLNYSEEVPRKRGRRSRGEDQNHSRSNESVDIINFLDGFGTENTNNENPLIAVDVNCDVNVSSPASSMNDSTIEHPKEKRKRPRSSTKGEKNYLNNESIETEILPTNSDETNEVDAFCMRLAASMRRLAPKTRSKVEIDILKLVYEAEFGEKV